jgi:hypothetical protein
MKISRRRKHNKRSKYTKRVKYTKRLKKTYKKTNGRRFIKNHNKRTLRGGTKGIDVRPLTDGSYKLVNTERSGMFSGDREDVVKMDYKQVKKRDVIDEGKFLDKILFSLYKEGKFNVSLRENDDGSYKVTLSLSGTKTSFSFNIKLIYMEDKFITFTIHYIHGVRAITIDTFRVQYTRKENGVGINIMPNTIFAKDGFGNTFVPLSTYNDQILYGIKDEQVSPETPSPDKAQEDYGYNFRIGPVFFAIINFIAGNPPSTSNMQEVDG